MTLHVEPIYGFYHGQDPRTFSPDYECCTEKEITTHKAACEAADKGEWKRDDSGCHSSADGSVKILKSSFGLGTYHVVMGEGGEYIRDATFDDYCREESWSENVESESA